MKNVISLAAVVMLITSPVYADTESEVMKQMKAFEAAFDKSDFDTIGKMYAEDAKVYPQGTPVTTGRAEIQKLWKSYEKDMTDVDYRSLEIYPIGDDYAIQYGAWEGKWQGQPSPGRFITVWHKRDDRWEIVRDEWHSEPAQ